MYTSPPLDSIVDLVNLVYSFVILGIGVSASGNVVYPILNKIRQWFGHEPMAPDEFELAFDRLRRPVSETIGRKVGALNRPPWETKILFQIILGLFIVGSAFILELFLAFVVWAVTIISYNFAWMSFDPVATYQQILALIVLFVFAFMNYEIQEFKRNLLYR